LWVSGPLRISSEREVNWLNWVFLRSARDRLKGWVNLRSSCIIIILDIDQGDRGIACSLESSLTASDRVTILRVSK
jgi:hypothetical protein